MAATFVGSLAACSTDDAARPTEDVEHGTSAVLMYETPSALIGLTDLGGASIVSPAAELATSPQDNPSWSPDGELIAFVSDEGVWTVDTSGTAELVVPCEGACLYLDDPAWSPDGEQIAYSRMSRDGSAALESIHLATGERGFQFNVDANDLTSGVAWAPDGTTVAFELVHTVGPEPVDDVVGVDLAVWTWDADAPGAAPPLLPVDPLRFPETPTWSSDGSRIVFGYRATRKAEATDLFTMAADGTGLVQLTDLGSTGGWATHPDWGPDGTIRFAGSLTGGDAEILQTTAEAGAEITPIADHTIRGTHPRLRPGP